MSALLVALVAMFVLPGCITADTTEQSPESSEPPVEVQYETEVVTVNAPLSFGTADDSYLASRHMLLEKRPTGHTGILIEVTVDSVGSGLGLNGASIAIQANASSAASNGNGNVVVASMEEQGPGEYRSWIPRKAWTKGQLIASVSAWGPEEGASIIVNGEFTFYLTTVRNGVLDPGFTALDP